MKKDKLITMMTVISVIIFIIGIFIINDHWEQKVLGSEKLATTYEADEELASWEKEQREKGAEVGKAFEDLKNANIVEMEEEAAIDIEKPTEQEVPKEAAIVTNKAANLIETSKGIELNEAAIPILEPVPTQEPTPIPEQAPESVSIPVPAPTTEQAPTQESTPTPETVPTQEPTPATEQSLETAPTPEETPTTEQAPESVLESQRTRKHEPTKAEQFPDRGTVRTSKPKYDDEISKRRKDIFRFFGK